MRSAHEARGKSEYDESDKKRKNLTTTTMLITKG
jgi:hypothetical protein